MFELTRSYCVERNISPIDRSTLCFVITEGIQSGRFMTWEAGTVITALLVLKQLQRDYLECSFVQPLKQPNTYSLDQWFGSTAREDGSPIEVSMQFEGDGLSQQSTSSSPSDMEQYLREWRHVCGWVDVARHAALTTSYLSFLLSSPHIKLSNEVIRLATGHVSRSTSWIPQRLGGRVDKSLRILMVCRFPQILTTPTSHNDRMPSGTFDLQSSWSSRVTVEFYMELNKSIKDVLKVLFAGVLSTKACIPNR